MAIAKNISPTNVLVFRFWPRELRKKGNVRVKNALAPKFNSQCGQYCYKLESLAWKLDNIISMRMFDSRQLSKNVVYILLT